MAENENGQDKSEQPTPKRIEDARKKGQVARSRDLNTTLVLLGGGFGLLLLGDQIVAALVGIMTTNFQLPVDLLDEPNRLPQVLWARILEALGALAPLFVVLAIAALAGPLALGGGRFSGKAVSPQLKRINPWQGLKRIFSAQGGMEFLKTLAKFSFIAAVAGTLLWHLASDIVLLGRLSVEQALREAGRIIHWVFLSLAGVVAIIAAIDVPFQIWNHQRQLKMTRQEVKDENKQTDGNPETKGRVRRIQQELANRRMMEKVPAADVVVTNPTHYAVALQYDQQADGAPRVVAKGTDLVAARIREIAAESGIPLVAAPPLARALYYNTRLEQQIPGELYIAVARVLAYVYQLRTAADDAAPPPPEDLEVPAELIRARSGTDEETL